VVRSRTRRRFEELETAEATRSALIGQIDLRFDLTATADNEYSPHSHCRTARGKISWRKILLGEDSGVDPSYVFTGVGGYYASKQGGLTGVFRCAADGTDWKHALSEIEAFTRATSDRSCVRYERTPRAPINAGSFL
jgi:hypothetical protein